MVHVNFATLNTHLCMVSVDTTSSLDAKWNFPITDVKNVLLLSNFRTTIVASNTVKSTMIMVVTLVIVATTSHRTDHAENTKMDA